jgi:hypothetical protein
MATTTTDARRAPIIGDARQSLTASDGDAAAGLLDDELGEPAPDDEPRVDEPEVLDGWIDAIGGVLRTINPLLEARAPLWALGESEIEVVSTGLAPACRKWIGAGALPVEVLALIALGSVYGPRWLEAADRDRSRHRTDDNGRHDGADRSDRPDPGTGRVGPGYVEIG